MIGERLEKVTVSAAESPQEQIFDAIEHDDMLSVLDLMAKLEPQFHNTVAEKMIEKGRVKVLAVMLDRCQGLGPKVAEEILDENFTELVAKNLASFTNLTTKIASRMISHYVSDVAAHLTSFNNLTYEVAKKLIKNEHAEAVVMALDRFTNVSESILADDIFSEGQSCVLANHFEKFKSLDPQMWADTLLNNGEGASLAANIEKFTGVNNQTVAEKLIESHEGESLLENLEKFKDLNYQLVFSLLASFRTFTESLDEQGDDVLLTVNYGDALAKHVDKFKTLSGPEMAEEMIKNGLGSSVAGGIEKFKDIDYQKISDELTNKGFSYAVAENLEKFSGVDPDAWAEARLQNGQLFAVIAFLGKFPKVNHAELLEKAFARKRVNNIPEYIDNFKGLDYTQTAKRLVAAGAAEEVAFYIGKFKDVKYSEVAEYMVEQGYSVALVSNIKKFGNVDYGALALRMIEKDEGHAVVNCLKKYDEWPATVAEKLVEAGYAQGVIWNLERFKDLNKLSLAKKCIESGQGEWIIRRFKNFEDLDNDLLADWLIKSDAATVFVDEGIKIFKGLSQATAEKLIDAGYVTQISKNITSFQHLNIEIAKRFIVAGHASVVDSRGVFDIPPEIETLQTAKHFRVAEAIIYYFASPEDKKSKAAYEIFKDTINEWQDNENICSPFQAGAEIFGEDKMFEYLGREGLSRHDGLHQFKDIVRLYKDSGLTPKEFYNNILAQVSSDNAEYYSGTAHHHLNDVSRKQFVDVDLTKEKVHEFNHIEKLQELFSGFASNADVFSSWKNLKKYDEVQGLLMQKEILEQLAELKNFPEKKKLREYIETLAFHPNISMEQVLSFWRTPEEFLEVGDSHTPVEVHNQKKPSNYIDFPNLDLSATELRDALVEGDYDTLQAFKPFMIEYSLGKQTAPVEPLAATLHRALGKRSENKKGEAKNAPKLFKELQKLCAERNIVLADVLAGKVEPLAEDAQALSALLYNNNTGLPLAVRKNENYRAKINKKSDPDAVVAGNDTACCMPFGSGKNNVYTFNPNCSLFTLQKRTNDGTWRTIAQSVLTEDVAIDRLIPEIIAEANSGERHLNALLTDDILSVRKSVIACDNIEVAETYKNKSDEIKIMYQDFFREYLKRFDPAGTRFNNDQIAIGMGYTDALTDLPKEENRFIPRAPVGYSDKLGDYIYSLELNDVIEAGTDILARKIHQPEAFPEKSAPDYLPAGVELLTFRDALPVAYIEGKAYEENDSLIEYLHNMENALIAKDVNNAAKKRPNMSLKYIGDDKKMHGYILAYEGKRHKQGENVVYVSDLASDGNLRAGGALILGFTESYKRNYINTGNLLPIYAQMRENTSYPIIKKQLDKLAKGTGIHFQMQEVRTYEQGGDMMHEVVISPVNSRER